MKYGKLSCTFVIGKKPEGVPVSERAIPSTIFKADPSVRKQYLSMWCRDSFNRQETISVRDVLDWEYYKERLGKAIQKIITIPAAMQKLSNPVPRVVHPDWLQKTIMRRNDKYKQHTLTMFTANTKPASELSRKPLFLIGSEPKESVAEASEMDVDGEETHAGKGSTKGKALCQYSKALSQGT